MKTKFYIFLIHIIVFAGAQKSIVKTVRSAVKAINSNRLASVETENGLVYGYRTDKPNNTTLKQTWTFFGIPYAKPPILEKRFADPDTNVPKKTRFAIIPQEGCVNGWGEKLRGKEDCLYLNIFSGVKPDPSHRLPVLVWIHGGAFIAGTGNLWPSYAHGFLENDVILVSIHYRLGIFGFLCTGDGASPGNYGLKDQIAALKWIQRNIINFGGDPDRVTIFGESAGAVSVHYLLQSKEAKNLFHAAISDSGTTLAQWAMNKDPLKMAYISAINAGIDMQENSTAELVDKLKTIDYATLQNASSIYNLNVQYNWNGLVWAPCMENESSPNAVVTGTSYDHLENGRYHQVPLLTGYNSNEFRIVFNPNMTFKLLNVSKEFFTDNLTNIVPEDMNIKDPEKLKEVANKIAEFYFGSNTQITNNTLSKYASDNMFVRPLLKTVELMSKNSDVYLYRFAYTGSARWQDYAVKGAGHGRELELLFDLSQKTEEAKLTARRMQKLWTNFAKYKNPTPDGERDEEIGIVWRRVELHGDMPYLNIDANLTMESKPEEQSTNFWNQLYQDYGNPPYSTYKK